MVVASIEVGGQARIKPPPGAVITGTVAGCVAVVVAVVGAERSTVMVVALTVAQSVACVPAVALSCQAEPVGRREG